MFLDNHNKTAIVFKDLKISYKSLIEHAQQYAKLFNAEETKKVLIYAENSPQWMYAFYSGWINNSVVVPVDCMAVAQEIEYIIDNSRPEIIFTSKNNYPILKEAIKNIDYKYRIIVFEDIEEQKSLDYSNIEVPNLEKTAIIIYTSGTTGDPKGVMLSYNNILSAIKSVSTYTKIYSPEDNVLILLPLHHIFPLLGTMVCPILIGSTVAMCPTLASEDIIDTLQKNKVTIMIGVPRLYNLIRDGIMKKINANRIAKSLFSLASKVNSMAFSKFIFKSVHKKFGGALKFLVCGGAAIDYDVARDYQILGFELLQGFGMSETTAMTTFTRPGDVVVGSCGKPLPGSKVKIVDGEILVKGNNIMQGYYKKEQETIDAFEDGWLKTGDLGALDSKGRLTVTGRKKELIVLSNGKNITPTELEFKLEAMSELIQEAAVFQFEEILYCAIFPNMSKVRENGISNIEQYLKIEVITKFNNSVSPYKRIMQFFITREELPKTRLSKIKRFKLSELVTKKESEKQINKSVENHREYNLIKEFIESEKKIEITPNQHLELDLSLDSLDQISLQSFIKSTFGIELEINKFLSFSSILKLADYIKLKKKKINLDITNWSDILKEKVNIKINRTSILSREIMHFSKYIFKFYFNLKSEGQKNIPSSPCLIVPNHQSFLDAFFVTSLLNRKTFSNTFFYAKAKHGKSRIAKFWIKRNNIILIDITKDVKDSVQKLAEALRQNKNIMIFPEGTRSKTSDIGVFKKTYAILSKELNIPIVPVAITGAHKSFPRGSFFPKPFKGVSISFLEAIHPKNLSYDEINDIVFNKINDIVKMT